MTFIEAIARTGLVATGAAAAIALGLALGGQSPAHAEETVEVGGAPMFPSKTIVKNAVNSADHETLVAAVKAAGLVEALSGEGPFMVFAPTDAAFAKLPEATVADLLKPENKAELRTVLTYHVVEAAALSDAIRRMVADDGGRHPVPTLSGGELIAMTSGEHIILVDERGRRAAVTIADVRQSNGVIHVIDTVLLPAG